MTKGGKLIEGIFKGETINTPSMLAVEDYICALEWAQGLGRPRRLDRARRRQCRRARRLGRRRRRGSSISPPTRRRASNTSVCLKFADGAVAGLDADGQNALVKAMAGLLEAEGAAFDVAGYRDAPPGLRIWCGAHGRKRRRRRARPLARLGVPRGSLVLTSRSPAKAGAHPHSGPRLSPGHKESK